MRSGVGIYGSTLSENIRGEIITRSCRQKDKSRFIYESMEHKSGWTQETNAVEYVIKHEVQRGEWEGRDV